MVPKFPEQTMGDLLFNRTRREFLEAVIKVSAETAWLLTCSRTQTTPCWRSTAEVRILQEHTPPYKHGFRSYYIALETTATLTCGRIGKRWQTVPVQTGTGLGCRKGLGLSVEVECPGNIAK